MVLNRDLVHDDFTFVTASPMPPHLDHNYYLFDAKILTCRGQGTVPTKSFYDYFFRLVHIFFNKLLTLCEQHHKPIFFYIITVYIMDIERQNINSKEGIIYV